MKKSKKFLSALLMVCMIMAMAVPAFAAEENISPLSENAGSTVKVLAQLVEADGTTVQKLVDVAIPSNATEEMESELISMESHSALGFNTMTRAASSQELSSLTRLNIAVTSSQKLGTYVGGGVLDNDYGYLEVSFSKLTPGLATLSVRVQHDGYAADDPNNNVYKSADLDGATAVCTLYANKKQGAGYLYLDKGDELSVYASCTTTVSSSASCVVKAYNI